MGSVTDLQGMFWSDESNLVAALGNWLVNGDADARKAPELPAVVYARWKREGATSDEELARVVLSVLPEQASSIVNELEAQLLPKLGPNPVGILRVRANGKGNAAKPGLDMQRTLRPGNFSTADPNVAYLRQVNDQLWLMNREMQAQRSEEHKALMSLVGKQGEDLSKFATLGAASQAIGANSTLGSVLGVAILIAIAPFIRGLVSGGVDPQIAMAWRGKLMAWLGMSPPTPAPALEKRQALPASTIPPGVKPRELAASTTSPELELDIDALIARARSDAGFAAQLASRAIQEPGILESLNLPPEMIMGARAMMPAQESA